MSYGNEKAYAMERTGAAPLIGPHSALGKTLHGLRWLVTLCVLVLFVDLLCVILVWGGDNQSLARLVATERGSLGITSQSAAGRMIDACVTFTHQWVFVRSGFEDWAILQQNGLLHAFANGLWFVADTAMQGLQLFALRCTVLVLALPLFVVVAITAVADGLYGWLMRRSRGARESGFIYHRAKRAFPATIMLLWLVYLVPPIAMNPRWLLPPFVVLFGLGLRLRIAYFKKHI